MVFIICRGTVVAKTLSGRNDKAEDPVLAGGLLKYGRGERPG